MSRGRSEPDTLKTQYARGARVTSGRGRVVRDEFREVKGVWTLPTFTGQGKVYGLYSCPGVTRMTLQPLQGSE